MSEPYSPYQELADLSAWTVGTTKRGAVVISAMPGNQDPIKNPSLSELAVRAGWTMMASGQKTILSTFPSEPPQKNETKAHTRKKTSTQQQEPKRPYSEDVNPGYAHREVALLNKEHGHNRSKDPTSRILGRHVNRSSDKLSANRPNNFVPLSSRLEGIVPR